MEFKKLQEKIIANGKTYCEIHKVSFDENFVLMKLYEELGELSQAHLIYKKKCRGEKIISKEQAKNNVAKEVADAFGTLIVYADLMNIDLEEAIDKKWISKEWLK